VDGLNIEKHERYEKMGMRFAQKSFKNLSKIYADAKGIIKIRVFRVFRCSLII